MREYSNIITLTKNGRGLYSIDPVFGCNTGMLNNVKGCFNDCYSARISKKYGYDFSKNVNRYFKDAKHEKSIINKINNIDFEFIRMGSNGDPSEDWEHTINIINKLKGINKEIVIITRHWNKLTEKQLIELSKSNVCINTSISAIDNKDELIKNIEQYEKLKKYCKSILRIVSFDFNLDNKIGFKYNKKQEDLFNKYDLLDTVFRGYKTNKLFTDGIILLKETKFLGKKCYVSKYNKKTYFGNCINCLDKCGIF